MTGDERRLTRAPTQRGPFGDSGISTTATLGDRIDDGSGPTPAAEPTSDSVETIDEAETDFNSVTVSPTGPVESEVVPESAYPGFPRTVDVAVAVNQAGAANSISRPESHGTRANRSDGCLEMRAVRLFPKTVGEWPTDDGGPYPAFHEDEQAFDRPRVGTLVDRDH